MGRVQSFPIDKEGRLKRNIYRDLILERRPVKPPVVALTIPKEPPTANEANSLGALRRPEGAISPPPSPGTHTETRRPSVQQKWGRFWSIRTWSRRRWVRIILPPPGARPGGNQEFRDPGAMKSWLTKYLKERAYPRWSDTRAGSPTLSGNPWGAGFTTMRSRRTRRIRRGRNCVFTWMPISSTSRRNCRVRVDVVTRSRRPRPFPQQALDLIRSLTPGPCQGHGCSPEHRQRIGSSPGPAPRRDGRRAGRESAPVPARAKHRRQAPAHHLQHASTADPPSPPR